jgi:hypothetical protein
MIKRVNCIHVDNRTCECSHEEYNSKITFIEKLFSFGRKRGCVGFLGGPNESDLTCPYREQHPRPAFTPKAPPAKNRQPKVEKGYEW